MIRERVNAGLAAARQRGKVGGRPRAIDAEKQTAIEQALAQGMSKMSVCRTFGIKRSTLYDLLHRIKVGNLKKGES